MLLSPWVKCSQDEYKTNNLESRKRPRRYTEGNPSPDSSSKRCETSFEMKRKKLDFVATRESPPAIDLPKKRSSHFQNDFRMHCQSETETLPSARKTKTSPARNDSSPIILSQIAEKVKLRKRKTVVASEHSYSKVTDTDSRIKYSKRKKRKKESLSSSCALKTVKESEIRKISTIASKKTVEASENDFVKKTPVKETKNVYAKKTRALRIRKKYSRPRLVTPDKKINRIGPDADVGKPATIKTKGTDEVSEKNISLDSFCGETSLTKDETNRKQRRKWSLGKKWSLGILPAKKKKMPNTKEISDGNKKLKSMERFASVRISMKQRNAILTKINAETALPDLKETCEEGDEENCYDRPEIMTLLLNLTRTINEMSSLDGPTQLKKQKARKSKVSKPQIKTHAVAKKLENHKNSKALPVTVLGNDSRSQVLETRDSVANITNVDQNIANSSPGIENSSYDLPNVDEIVENSSIVVLSGCDSVHSGKNEEARKRSRQDRLQKENNVEIPAAQNEIESENSNVVEPSLRARPAEREEFYDSNTEISKDIFSPDLSVDATNRSAPSVDENAKKEEPFRKSQEARVNTLATEKNLPDRPVPQKHSETSTAVEMLSSSEEKGDSDKNSGNDEERAKQLSLVRFLRSSIGSLERNDEDDKDTVIFNLSDVSRPLVPDSSEFVSRTKKSIEIDKLRKLKMQRLRKKRKIFNGNKKWKRKAKFKRGALKKASAKTAKTTKTTSTSEKTENSTPAKNPEFLTTLKEVSSLIKRLHESHQIILFLEKDMASKPELSDHFKPVISAQYANYRNNISKYKGIILQGVDTMSGILSESGLVTAEISKEALLGEEEVSNVISRCVLAGDVPERSRKESEGDGLSVSDSGSTGNLEPSRSSRENERPTACSSVNSDLGIVSPDSFEIPDSAGATVSVSGLSDAGKTAPKVLPVRSFSDETPFGRDGTRTQNVFEKSPPTPTGFPSASNGTCKNSPAPRKGKTPPTKSVGFQNHPFKISMTKSGLCLRLGDGAGGFVPLENRMTQSIIHQVATSYLKSTASAQTKANEKDSTEENLNGPMRSTAEFSVGRPATADGNNTQKEPSKFLQGFVREFVGPLRHSVILPCTKSVAVACDKLGVETPGSIGLKFPEPGPKKQTTAQVFVMKLKEPQICQARKKEDSETVPSIKSNLISAEEVSDREMLVAKARNSLQAALFKAGQATQAKEPYKNLALGQDSQNDSFLMATGTNTESDSRFDDCTLQKTGKFSSVTSETKRTSPSKASSEDLSRTSPDTQKKAMAQLIELSKKLVETRSLLRRSAGAARLSASNFSSPEKLKSPSGSNGKPVTCARRPKSPATPASKPTAEERTLSDPDTSLFPDAKASTTVALRRSERFHVPVPVSDAKACSTVALRRSKRFRTPDDSPEPSTSNISLSLFQNERKEKEKETPGKKAGMHFNLAIIKTEKESVEDIGESNFISREGSSSGETQSDDEDVYFDMDKVKKELEDVHGLIHFICAENKCMNPGTEICTGCQSVLYCGRQCQARHWNKKHYKHCEELKKMAQERKKNKIVGT